MTFTEQVSAALRTLAPGAQWSFSGTADLSGLVWLDTVIARPTDAAINVAIASGPPATILPQDLMAQFTTTDATAIRTALNGATTNAWLTWHLFLSHKGVFVVTDVKFLQIWNALVTLLGQTRMNAIATALGATSLVV